MEAPLRGDVVVVPFPFSDLSDGKRRPALVLAELDGTDAILCQITSSLKSDGHAVALESADIIGGTLDKECNIRPNVLFTADCRIVEYRVGKLTAAKLAQVVERLIGILRG